MKVATLAEDFEALRKSKHMTFLEIANRCDLNETTVHKVSSGRTVRWETLHLILSIGMSVHPGTSDYESIHRLWMAQREKIAAAKPADKAKKKSSKHEDFAIAQFRKLIKGKSAAKVREITAAAVKAAKKV